MFDINAVLENPLEYDKALKQHIILVIAEIILRLNFNSPCNIKSKIKKEKLATRNNIST